MAFPHSNGSDQGDINEGQPSDAIESVVAEKDEFAVLHLAGDGMATENALGEERPVDAGTPGSGVNTGNLIAGHP